MPIKFQATQERTEKFHMIAGLLEYVLLNVNLEFDKGCYEPVIN
jgi:hypothetical protein